MKILVCSVQIISRLDSQSKFQMFTLFSGRNIGVPRRSPPFRGDVQGARLRFNEAHKKTRSTTERANGVIKKRF